MNVCQRDIVLISLDPTKGHEQRGTRPAVVISAEAFHVSGLCIVCPLTTTIRNLAGNVVLQPNAANKLKKESEVLCGHVRSVSVNRIAKKIGALDESLLQKVFAGIDALCGR